MFSHFSPYFPSELDLKPYLTWSFGFIKGENKTENKSYSLSHNHISNTDCQHHSCNSPMVCNSEQPAFCLFITAEINPNKWFAVLFTFCIAPDSFPTSTVTRSHARHQVCAALRTQLVIQQLPLRSKVNQDLKKKNLLTNKLGQFKHPFALYVKPPQKHVIT